MKWEKELPYLWEEYQYRHDLVWRIALRLGLVVATLSVIPYANDALMIKMGRLMLIPPALAFLLAILGSGVICNEHRLLMTIKMAYRRLQNDFFSATFSNRTDGEVPKLPNGNLFAVFLVFYLLSLVGLTVANFVLLLVTLECI